MATTQTKTEWDAERWLIAAAIFAGACNLSCWVAFFISMALRNERRSMGKKIEVFVRLSLISALVLTQTPTAYSIEVSTPGTSNVNNCNAPKSDFGADLKRLSDTIKRGQDIPQEFLERHFAGCTIENARKLLVKNGFAADELGPEFDKNEPEKVIPRTMMLPKAFGTLASLAR